MSTVFFILSKLLGAALKLETWLLVMAFVTFWASRRDKPRTVKVMSFAMVLTILGIGLLPLGDVLLRPLETEFPVKDNLTRVDGIVLLGGGEDVSASRYAGQPQLDSGGDRYVAALALARAHPGARVLFAGGSGRLRDVTGADMSEAAIAERIFAAQGIAQDRMLFESQSRNTAENARLSRELAKPGTGEVWVLITSAFHMPRAVGSFKNAGWQEIVPFPVDFRTRHWRDGLGWNFQRNLGLMNLALREWVGRLVYAGTER